ncbi:mediator of RNA polymerase II transcription subunit 18 [[Candida] anglica]|uniref:Mediator of RNA polymerase II transcription subunit 18 n=1 Tax=[Candida] anglica TaxID=148631 RepID=A0ABP0EA48_9ASCO
MVQQLCLVATIPHNKYIQTVSTLKALTGIETPQDIATYTLLTKPYQEFKPKLEPGKVNQIEQYFMKCVTTWDDQTSAKFDSAKPVLKDDKEGVWADTLFSDSSTTSIKRNWTLQISDIPTAGKNQTCSAQTVYESTLVHHHSRTENKTSEGTQQESFLSLLHDLGYEVKNQYWIRGVRYFHGDIFIEIFKVFIRDDDFESQNNQIKLKLLDQSNTFQVKVYINVPRATDVELINQASKNLLKFQELVKNLINLEIPDRMYMDSRVK